MDIIKLSKVIIFLLFLLIPLGFIAESLVVLLILLTCRWDNVIPVLVYVLLLLAHILCIHLLYDYSLIKPIQQLALISFYGVGYSAFYKRLACNIDIWGSYLNACFFYACIAVFQGFIFLLTGEDILGFARNVVSDSSIRLHAYFEEPGTFVTFMSPCVAYYLYNIKFLKTYPLRFSVIFVTYLLSLSSIGFVVFFLIGVHKLLCSKYKYLLLVPLMLGVLFLGKMLLEQEKLSSETGYTEAAFIKIGETATAFSNLSPGDFELLNMSSYASMSNLWVAINSPDRLLGTGIGTHPESYERLYQSDYQHYGLNKEDAYSLLTRVFSEFGLFGVIVLFFFIRFNYNKGNLINVSVLYYILASMLRGGHYTYNGLFFFFFLFYLTSERKNLVFR